MLGLIEPATRRRGVTNSDRLPIAVCEHLGHRGYGPVRISRKWNIIKDIAALRRPGAGSRVDTSERPMKHCLRLF
jgi:hypothetical protein